MHEYVNELMNVIAFQLVHATCSVRFGRTATKAAGNVSAKHTLLGSNVIPATMGFG